jgi:hypothetical protein
MADIIQRRKAFIIHGGISVMVSMFLLGINFLTGLGTYKVDQLARRWEDYEQDKINDTFENRRLLGQVEKDQKLDLEELERLKEIELEDRDLV